MQLLQSRIFTAILSRDARLTNHNKVAQLPNQNSTRNKNMQTAGVPSAGKRTPVAKRRKKYDCFRARENVPPLPSARKMRNRLIWLHFASDWVKDTQKIAGCELRSKL